MQQQQTLTQKLVIAIIFANIFDAYATYYLTSSGIFYEANTWLAGLYKNYGYIKGVASIKFSLAVVLSFCPDRVSGAVVFIMTFVLSSYVCLMLWHLYLISFTTRIL